MKVATSKEKSVGYRVDCVVSAVFTNDIYKGILNPGATDKQLILAIAEWLTARKFVPLLFKTQ